jgi:hypothetical protein
MALNVASNRGAMCATIAAGVSRPGGTSSRASDMNQ